MLGVVPQALLLNATDSFGAYSLMPDRVKLELGCRLTLPSAAASTARSLKVPAVMSAELTAMPKVQATLSLAGMVKAGGLPAVQLSVWASPSAVSMRLV